MLSYEVYKVIHVFSVVAMAMLGGIAITNDNLSKAMKIGIGVFSFIILVAGMGLLARIGVSHGSGFPTWVIIKMFIWLALAGLFGYASKRSVKNELAIKASAMVLFLVAIILAIFKAS